MARLSSDNHHKTEPRAMGSCQLVAGLISAAYDSGYYSGKREDGTQHHLRAILRRNQLRDELLARLSVLDTGGKNDRGQT